MDFLIFPPSNLVFTRCTESRVDLFHQQQQHSQLVAQRKFSYDSNGNANLYQRSAKEYCNLPQISDHRLNDQANRIIAKQTAKKTIKVFTAIDYPVF